MTTKPSFSPLTTLRTGLAAGKLRLELRKLNSERVKLEQAQTQAIADVGVRAWEHKVNHPDYATQFAQLGALDQQRATVFGKEGAAPEGTGFSWPTRR